MEYIIFSFILESKLINIKYNWNLYYFFINKNNILFNLKYSKELYLSIYDFNNIKKELSKKYNIIWFIFYNLDNSKIWKTVHNIVFKYNEKSLSKNTLKYEKKIKKLWIFSKFMEINKKNIELFYNLYSKFSQEKGFNIKKIEFFIKLFLEFKTNFYILNIYDSLWNIIWSTILLKYEDKILLMYWWYNEKYTKKWLKYYINIFIIDYFKNDNTINEVIFWTWYNEFDESDSLLQFKSKFWNIYKLNKLKWYSE